MKDGKRKKRSNKDRYIEGYIVGLLSDKIATKNKSIIKGFRQSKIEVKGIQDDKG